MSWLKRAVLICNQAIVALFLVLFYFTLLAMIALPVRVYEFVTQRTVRNTYWKTPLPPTDVTSDY